ncbi:MAG: hypothetical protein A2X32_05140 [Elusimicrobia bacterium GWC2_64_44]|nr:MAG: hypothetical protein A2X32_05140 [Elusimicrobia bacterium GWC2_64_44]
MNARLTISLLPAALLLWAGSLFAAGLSSPGFADLSGTYGFGSASMVSANFEGDGNVQEVSVSTQEAPSFSQRSGKLSFFPAPAPVSDLAVVIVSSSGLRITWTAPYADARRQYGAADDYVLRYTTSGYITTDEQFRTASPYVSAWTPLEAGGTETRLLEGFNAGTTYYFAVEAVNAHAIRSELSNQVASFALVPLAPMNFQITRAGNSVTMTWIPPAGFQNRIPFNDRFSPAYPYEIKKYALYRATAPAAADWEFIGETSSSTLSWTDIIGASDVYYYHARSVNQAGESIPSYGRGSTPGGLYFLAPDNQSMLEVPAEAGGSFYSASGDPMDSYTIEISSHAEDLGGRVMKSVEFSAFRGGIQADSAFKLAKSGTLKLFYAKAGGTITPSVATDGKALSMFYNNGSRWLQLFGKVNEAERSVQLETSLLGRYQLRTTERSGSFAADKAGLLNRLITPNGDGKNDTMVFIFDNPQDKQVKGRIYDLRGAQVAAMKTGPVSNSLAWDAKAGGQTVPGGVYIYQLEADGTVYNGTVVVIK